MAAVGDSAESIDQNSVLFMTFHPFRDEWYLVLVVDRRGRLFYDVVTVIDNVVSEVIQFWGHGAVEMARRRVFHLQYMADGEMESFVAKNGAAG